MVSTCACARACASAHVRVHVPVQVGYSAAYGQHGAGFALSTLGQLTLEGLCLLVALAGQGLILTTKEKVTSPVAAALAADAALLERLDQLEVAIELLKSEPTTIVL